MRVSKTLRKHWSGWSRSPRLTRSMISASHSKLRPTQPQRQKAWKVFKRNSKKKFLYSSKLKIVQIREYVHNILFILSLSLSMVSALKVL